MSALDAPHAVARSEPAAEGWVREVLESGRTLFEAARTHPERTRLDGRGPAWAIPGRNARWVVRHYRRGGWMAPLLDDRYLRLGRPRPFRELAASRAVAARGIPTPRVLAAAVYPAGLVYRGDLVTELVPGGRDLAEVLFGDAAGRATTAEGGGAEPGPGIDPVAALEASGRLLARMAEAGVYHPDLNAKNLLFAEASDGLRALVIDLDRCVLRSTPREGDRKRMHARLLRSLAKWEARAGDSLPGAALAVLAAASEEGRGVSS